MTATPERLRTTPALRFAGESHLFDLKQKLSELRGEAHPSQRGHRQVTLFHRAPVTQVLFAFDAGGELAEHAARGLVTIQILEGHFTIEADGQTHAMQSGMLLVLTPGVRHSVRAVEAGAMLLTVHLESDK